MRNQEISSRLFVTAVFWELVSIGSTVAALLHIGFTEADIDAVGVLSGPAPDLSAFLDSVGLPRADRIYYNDCFQDGALLLIVRTQPGKQRIALEIVRRHGGILPPSQQLQPAAAHGSEGQVHPYAS